MVAAAAATLTAMLVWLTAIAALVAAAGTLATVSLMIWWRRPQMIVGRLDGWTSVGDALLGLPVRVTNDGDRPIRNITLEGLHNGRVVTEPAWISDVPPLAHRDAFVNFPRPQFAEPAAGGDVAEMPQGPLQVRVKAGRKTATADLSRTA